MPVTLLARYWDLLKQRFDMPDGVVPVDISETAKWFFEEDDTEYRDARIRRLTKCRRSGSVTLSASARLGTWV